MTIAKSPAEVLAGEAVSGTSQQRWNDMLNIASVMVNRAAMLGVSLDDVVSVQSQFNAYNKAMPAGTQSLVDMAQAALDQVQEQGPVNNASFYATPEAANNLPGGLVEETSTDGHQFYSDPAMRAIQTAVGTIRPDPNALPSIASLDPLQKAIQAPYENNGLLNGVTSLTNAPAQAVTSQSMPAGALDPAFQPNGLLSGNFPASQFTAPASNMGILATQDQNLPNLSPSLNSFAPVAAATPVATPFQNQWEAMASAPPVGDATGISITGLPTGQSDVATGNFDPSRIANSSALDKVMQTPSAILDAPEAHPNVNNFADMAAAGPMTAPVSVQGMLGAMNQPNLAASAGVPLSASLFSPNVQQPQSVTPAMASNMGVLATGDNLLGNTAPTVSSWDAMAAAAPVQAPVADATKTPTVSGWDAMASAAPVQAPTSQFGNINSPEQQAMDARVTQHLQEMEQARLAAQTYDPVSAYSPTTVSAPAETAINTVAGPSSVPDQYSAPTNYSQLPSSNIPALSQPVVDANNPFTAGMLAAQPTQTPTDSTLSGILGQSPSLMSSTSLESQTPALSTPTPTSSMLSNSVTPSYQQYQSFVPDDVQSIAPAAAPAYDPSAGYQQAANSLMAGGMLNLDGTKYTNLNGDLAANPALSSPSTVNVASDPAVSVPSLDIATVADQPSIAAPTDTTQSNVTVQGPATTTAVTQQQPSLSGSFPAAPAKTGMLGGLVNKGTLAGGLLGSLAAGPFGGILGGILGNQINQNGGLTGLLGGQAPNINNIGAGLQNVASVYGGAPTGTQAYTSNGGTVTSLGGGWTAYTNQYGVTTTEGPNNTHASWFGGDLSGSSHTPGGPPGGGGGVGGFGSLL